MASTEWRLLRHPAALTVIGLNFALMARGKHRNAAEVLLTGEVSRLETNEEEATNLHIESHATILDISSSPQKEA